MSGKMTVLYLDHTGHVVAAMREPSSGPPKLEALVGESFPLGVVRRNGGSHNARSFDLPASILKSKSVALDERVIAAPQRFAIDSDRVALLPDSAPTGPTVSDLDQTVIKLNLATGAPAADINVLSIVRVVASGEQRIQAGSFVATSADTVLNLAIAPPGPPAGLPAAAHCSICIAFAGRPLIYTDDAT